MIKLREANRLEQLDLLPPPISLLMTERSLLVEPVALHGSSSSPSSASTSLAMYASAKSHSVKFAVRVSIPRNKIPADTSNVYVGCDFFAPSSDGVSQYVSVQPVIKGEKRERRHSYIQRFSKIELTHHASGFLSLMMLAFPVEKAILDSARCCRVWLMRMDKATPEPVNPQLITWGMMDLKGKKNLEFSFLFFFDFILFFQLQSQSQEKRRATKTWKMTTVAVANQPIIDCLNISISFHFVFPFCLSSSDQSSSSSSISSSISAPRRAKRSVASSEDHDQPSTAPTNKSSSSTSAAVEAFEADGGGGAYQGLRQPGLYIAQVRSAE